MSTEAVHFVVCFMSNFRDNPQIFSWEPALWTLMSQERVLMWSQKKHKWKVLSKKSIAIFGYKQRLLSIEIKTKVVKHVESDWMRDWKSVRVRKSESERGWEWESVRIGWCGWGPKKTIAIFSNKQWVFSIEMKTKLVQHVESDWMRDWKSVRVRVR